MNLKKLLLAGAVFGSVVTAALAGPQPGVNSPYQPVWEIPIDSLKWSYGLGFELSPSVGATDIFQLCGDPLSGVVTRVTRIAIAGRATTSASVPVFLIRRTPNSGGGMPPQVPFLSAAVNGESYDRVNGVSKSQATAYQISITPTLTLGGTFGPAAGLIAATQLFLGNLTTGQPGPTALFEFGNRPTQGLILHGGNDCVSVNLSNSTNSGNLLDMQVEWTEE